MKKTLPHTIATLHTRLRFLLGKRNLIYTTWWNIKMGKNARFDGKMIFRKYPGATISVGHSCTFLSATYSNLIGVNRPCMLSTLKSAYPASIQIGDNCGFSGTVVGAFLSVKIGNNVKCGANTLITDSDWHPEDSRSGNPRPVIIEDNVWIGVNTTVLKGAHIGANTVIGANSVVTGRIPANVIAAGNPCKVIREINPETTQQ